MTNPVTIGLVIFLFKHNLCIRVHKEMNTWFKNEWSYLVLKLICSYIKDTVIKFNVDN